MYQSQESDTDWAEEFNWADYDDYIYEDFKSRVFVDFEVFMKHVLHVPDDWKSVWGPAIEAVKADSDFKRHHEEYCNHRDGLGPRETFYRPLMNAANAVLEVVSRSEFSDIPSNISNLAVLYKGCQPSEEGFRRENPLRVLKVNPYNSALCDGTNMPRLVVDGEHAASSFSGWT